MKKYISLKYVLLMLGALMAAILIGYSAGYFVGKNISLPDNSQTTPPSRTEQAQDVKASDKLAGLEQQVTLQEKEKQRLTAELEAKNNEITRLKQVLENSAANEMPQPQEEVIPATAYERTNFVTNLVHQFNASNNSTEIIDISCETDFCFLTANVSAGSQTNPEIANLMRFLGEKQAPAYYQRVDLLKVTKQDNHSEIKLSLNM